MEPVTKRLTSEHRRIEGFFDELEATGENESVKRLELLKQLRDEVIAHMSAEEEVVYREMKDAGLECFDIRESEQEHHVARVLLKELEGLSPNHKSWLPKAHVLGEHLKHHHQEEEKGLFPAFEREFSERFGKELTRAYEAKKAAVDPTAYSA